MRKLSKLLLLTGAAMGGMVLVNRRLAEAYRPIYSEVDGEPGIYVWRDGVVYYHSKGAGDPMVLLHGFHPFSSSHEMKPVYDELSRDYRVYAVDWLGYGQSNRPPVEHTAGAYQQLLADFIGDVIQAPAIVVAAGPGAAFAARLAHRQPEKVARLILVNPTGVEELAEPPNALQRAIRYILRLPVVGDFAFNLVTSKPALRWSLKNRVFFDASQVTESLVEYAWTTSHQPGAKWGPLSYWSGLLNLCVAQDLAALQQPTMVIWGQQARYAPVEGIQGFKRYKPDARYRAFDRTREWPQVENPKAFNALVRNWLQGKDYGAAAIFPGEVEPEEQGIGDRG
ncbi:MAG: alpha/beta hydrolase [Anaerolineae bacterium]|nr:alpha/beta hydrolase [Anaerolineae bacterium]